MPNLSISPHLLKNYLGTNLRIRFEADVLYQHLESIGKNEIRTAIIIPRHMPQYTVSSHQNFKGKPLVYRMKDLDKEMLLDYQQITPIIELAKLITHKGYCWADIAEIKVEENTVTCLWPWTRSIMGNQIQRFFDVDTDDVCFSIGYIVRRPDGSEHHEFCMTGNHWAMYQKLFEMHFWPFGEEYFEKELVYDLRGSWGKEGAIGQLKKFSADEEP